jgi:hypothetical protein
MPGDKTQKEQGATDDGAEMKEISITEYCQVAMRSF